MAATFDLEALVDKLLNIGQQGAVLTSNVSGEKLQPLLMMAREVFLSQPSLVEVRPTVHLP